MDLQMAQMNGYVVTESIPAFGSNSKIMAAGILITLR
jgi:CheY-like chemotaxis protein